jgi:hypothetical protein
MTHTTKAFLWFLLAAFLPLFWNYAAFNWQILQDGWVHNYWHDENHLAVALCVTTMMFCVGCGWWNLEQID